MYTIVVNSHLGSAKTTFKVEDYVLPKFEVTLDAPASISQGSSEIEFTVCAK